MESIHDPKKSNRRSTESDQQVFTRQYSFFFARHIDDLDIRHAALRCQFSISTLGDDLVGRAIDVFWFLPLVILGLEKEIKSFPRIIPDTTSVRHYNDTTFHIRCVFKI